MSPARTPLVVALLVVAATAHADERTIVVAEAASVTAEDTAVFQAAARGVRRAIPDAAIADASLADSAFILGCDPAADACRDDVGAQLGYQRMVIVARRGGEVTVTVRGASGGGERRFPVAGTDPPALSTLEADVATMMAPTAAGGPARASGPARTPRAALYLGAGGVVAVIAGVTLWGLAASTQGDIDDAPTATADDLRHLRDLEDRGDRYATVGNVVVVLGGAAIAGAGAWIWYHRRGERAPAVQVTPAVSPGGAALVLGGAW